MKFEELLIYISAIPAAIVYTEFIGYWLHRFMHIDKIKYFSLSHMIHHLKLYGPKMPKRTDKYLSAVINRASIGKVGLEWLIPAGACVIGTFFLIYLIGFDIYFNSVFIVVTISWILVNFNYIHDGMHVKDFWMTKNKIVKSTFLKARRLHDLHHMELNNKGQMNKNFGISFFWFDRIFGTYQKHPKPFNEEGYEAALKRYKYIFS
ncbi:MAG: sterol desaturase family protein [Spirochaetia bacterium]|nr:sterol desaturase family protein [Spirochaetia bacterium]